MNKPKYKIGYALSGGFVKGFAHLGIMQALHEHGIHPHILSGVSAGAIASVFYADGKEPYQIMELFQDTSFHKLTKVSISKQSLLKFDGFIDFIKSNLQAQRLEELKIPTYITATDFDHGRLVTFKEGEITERVAASCCLPILFPPQKIEGTNYVDGGVLMNLPVTPIRNLCEQVIAFDVIPFNADPLKLNMASIAMRTFYFTFQANSLPERGLADLLIEPYELSGYGYTELEKGKEIFERGYLTAQKTLQELDQNRLKTLKQPTRKSYNRTIIEELAQRARGLWKPSERSLSPTKDPKK
ncbi:MAG: patatin-like phospholipase family protein [Phocaeicola sp.]